MSLDSTDVLFEAMSDSKPNFI